MKKMNNEVEREKEYGKDNALVRDVEGMEYANYNVNYFGFGPTEEEWQ